MSFWLVPISTTLSDCKALLLVIAYIQVLPEGGYCFA